MSVIKKNMTFYCEFLQCTILENQDFTLENVIVKVCMNPEWVIYNHKSKRLADVIHEWWQDGGTKD